MYGVTHLSTLRKVLSLMLSVTVFQERTYLPHREHLPWIASTEQLKEDICCSMLTNEPTVSSSLRNISKLETK